ncbi:hypothetical protein KIN20_007659 [Parelaphostrongylus tenuis]|uniref:Uncharacterized protein n=1 Tax=Parelaphostrongylus tenuis TaxID=148309 RepID=A0AAD5QHZ4_PARTN|nr:hypothetical protein KIN20_007659 [Parelaphostrongylus tenuis]
MSGYVAARIGVISINVNRDIHVTMNTNKSDVGPNQVEEGRLTAWSTTKVRDQPEKDHIVDGLSGFYQRKCKGDE